MDKSIERKLDKIDNLYFGCNGHLSAKDIIEQAKHWNMSNSAEIYNEDTGEIYKDAEMLTDAELKEFLKNCIKKELL